MTNVKVWGTDPVDSRLFGRLSLACVLATALSMATVGGAGCRKDAPPPAEAGEAVASLQVVRPEVNLVLPGGKEQRAGWSTRVGAGARVISASGRAWIHHDGGVRALVGAASEVLVSEGGVEVKRGRIWVEAPQGEEVLVKVAGARVSAAQTGFEVALPPKGLPRVYVARGRLEVRVGDRIWEVAAGQAAVIGAKGQVTLQDVQLWEDWTGGLAWPAPDTPAAPPGMGEIGARMPGSLGKASFPLAVRSLKVSSRVDGDRVATVVDQVFFNPASDDLEGLYRVRLPEGAILQAFCIDRPNLPGVLACGYVKERQQARAEYQAQVYVGSRDDPALLEWDAPGSYRARLYPLKAGATRRVVILYSEWLERDQGTGESASQAVRRWRYPLAVPGGAGPLVQEFRLEVDITDSGAKRVEAGLGAVVDSGLVVLQASDFQPRADFVLAFHGGAKITEARGYLSKGDAEEGRYLMVRVAPSELALAGRREPLDLVVVVDTSADTDPTELLLAQATVAALVGHLGPDDRVAVLGADLDLRARQGEKLALGPATPERREAALEALARREVGGATDLGRMLTDAAGLLDPTRGGAVVYVGDGVPTVGELDAANLLKRLARLARPVRLYGVAVGPEADLGLLSSLAEHEGGLALRVADRAEAGEAALRLLGHASRPAMHRVEVSVGPQVERVFPARAVTAVAGKDLVILGRLRGPAPASVTLKGWHRGKKIERKLPVEVARVADDGDLRRRWATSRLHELLAAGAGREEVAELGTRFGLITAHTSFYVPSLGEVNRDSDARRQVFQANRVLHRERDKQKAQAEQRRERKKAQRHKEKRVSKDSAKAANESDDTGAEAPEEAKSEDSEGRLMQDEMKPTSRASRPGVMSASDQSMEKSASAPSPPKRAAASSPVLAEPSADPGPVDDRLGGKGRRSTGAAAPLQGLTPQESEAAPRHSGRGVGIDDGGFGGSGGGGGQASAMSARGDAPARRPSRRPARLRGEASRVSRTGEVVDGRGPKSDVAGYYRPDQAPTSGARRRIDVHVYIHGDGKTHVPKHCSAASRQPLEQRSVLWRERLTRHRAAMGAREVWLDALRHCEAPRWRDRRTLLSAILGRLGAVREMVSFARLSRRLMDRGAWAYLQRAIFARLRTAADLRLAQALFNPGQGVDWTEVEKLLARLTSDQARAKELLSLLALYPTDVRLKKMTLELLERAGEHTAAERLAEGVAGNPYADAELRTAVGEYWARRDQSRRARRIFSEIVEFRPTDPRARRRLGDLYRAFGWYEEAYRQYQTLAVLAPHDSSVLLLMALAAAGAGRVDEALRLEQRVAESAAGSGGAARWALLWSSVRLAELREEARQKKDDEAMATLLGRTQRSGVLGHARPLRVILTWAHPEADLELWGAHPGWRMQRADELGPQFGIEAFSLRKVAAGRYLFEVRRVGRMSSRHLEATLYVLWDEGTPEERLQRFPLKFSPETKALRFAVESRNAEAVK